MLKNTHSQTGHVSQCNSEQKRCDLHAEQLRQKHGPISFPPQEWLGERASILRYTHFAYLVSGFVRLSFTFLSPVCFPSVITYLFKFTGLTYLLTYSLTYLLTYLLTYSLTYLLTYLLTSSLTYSLTHLLTHFRTHLPTYLLTHLLTYLITYLLTYSLNYLLIY